MEIFAEFPIALALAGGEVLVPPFFGVLAHRQRVFERGREDLFCEKRVDQLVGSGDSWILEDKSGSTGAGRMCSCRLSLGRFSSWFGTRSLALGVF